MRFRTRVGLYSVLISLLPLGVVIALSIWFTSQLVLELTLKRAQSQMQTIAAELDGFFKQRQSEISVLAAQPQLQSKSFSSSLDYLKQELERHQGIYEKFILGQSNGHFLNTHGGNPNQDFIRTFDDDDPGAKPRNIRQRDYWQQTVGNNPSAEPRVYTSNPMISYTTGVRQIVVAGTVLDDDKKVKGLIGGSIPWETVEDLIQKAHYRLGDDYPSARFAMIAPDGTYWYHWNKNKVIRVKRGIDGRIVRTEGGEQASESTSILVEESGALRQIGVNLLSGEAGFQHIGKNGAQGPQDYAIYRPIGSVNYGLLLLVSDDEILAPMMRLVWWLSGTFGAVFVFVCAAIVLSSKQIARPIHRLRQAIQGYGADRRQPMVLHSGITEMNNLVSDVMRLISTVRDTEQKRNDELAAANEALKVEKHKAEEASRAKSEFLANMSHEIRTPMNAVTGMADLCLLTDLTKTQRDYLLKLKSASGALLGIINDILDFSKIEAGKLDLEFVHFDLNELLEDLSNIIALSAEEKSLEFLLDVDLDTPCELRGDPLRFTQILINLCNNAVKFTEKGDVRVTIAPLKVEDKYVEIIIEVKDTGIGIEPDKIAHLFDPFYQSDTSSTRRHGGTGLGLAITKYIIEAMDGRLDVQSEFGKGSTFTVVLPFEIADHNVLEYQRLADCMQGRTVLVVDDNPHARSIFQQTLSRFGCKVFTASTGREAIDLCSGRQFDLILLDWNMPDMDGIETYRYIKGLDNQVKIPEVIMATAHGHDRIRQEAKEAGIDQFLSKPVRNSTLFDAVAGKLVYHRDPDEASSDAAEELSLHIDEPLRGAHIMVVEDTPLNQEIARSLLEEAGFEVITANNGEEALDALNLHHIDLILMDVQMPVMDGYETTQVIRKLGPYSQLPIIAMTANAMAEDKQKSLDAGMNDHLSKPIDLELLLEKVNEWLKSSR